MRDTIIHSKSNVVLLRECGYDVIYEKLGSKVSNKLMVAMRPLDGQVFLDLSTEDLRILYDALSDIDKEFQESSKSGLDKKQYELIRGEMKSLLDIIKAEPAWKT